MSNASPPPLFDRALIVRRLERAYRAAPVNPGADFLMRAAAEEMADRLSVVRRQFAVAVDVGSPAPHAADALAAREGGATTLRLAPSPLGLGGGGYVGAVADIERLALAPERCDLIVSLLALHHVNDLPGALIQIRRALRPDGYFLAALAGGETLTELRQSLIAAESEILGGASPRVAPFADVRALGGLMQRAGFALPVVDADRTIVRYDDIFALMRDLRAFGATNALNLRSRTPMRRDVLVRAAAIYAERFADADGRLRATFDIIWLTGWAPDESQPKPLRPGSAKMRLADALKAREGGH